MKRDIKGSTVFTSGHAMFVTACGALPMVNGMAMGLFVISFPYTGGQATGGCQLPPCWTRKENVKVIERMGERLNTGGISGC